MSDIVSSITISFPYDYPLWLNYLVSILYLFSYITTAVVYLLYTDSLAKISILERVVPKILGVLMIYEVFIAVSSPWTHWLAYFDENRVYCHGPLYPPQFAISAILLISAVLVVIKGRVRFSRFQQVILILFSVAVITTVVFQVYYPKILLGAFGSSLMLIFLYISFENPAYYFYRETKCHNRDGYYRAVKEVMNRGHAFSVIAGRFENVNVALNNTQRDNLRRRVADRLAANFKLDAFLLENSSFAVLIRNTSDDLSKEKRVEERIKTLFGEPIVLPEREVSLKVSTAILPHTYRFHSVNEMENIMDMMVTGAEAGADLSPYDRVDAIVKQYRRMALLESIVQKAIEEESFQVYYQPIYNIETKRFESAEALVRLIDRDEGFISPEEFIPLTERVGQILPLGEIVFKKVCQFLSTTDYKSLGINYIEVNLSPLQCERREVMDRFLEIMKEKNIQFGTVNFEITETAEADIQFGTSISNNILHMHGKGISFSLDDFGSGFAAMDHLFQLPINLVKVDKSILWQAMEDPNAMIVLRNTCRMIKDLGKYILVEGVETQEMVDVLIEFGCKYMQGYYYSRPLPEKDFIEFLKKNNN